MRFLRNSEACQLLLHINSEAFIAVASSYVEIMECSSIVIHCFWTIVSMPREAL